MINETPCRHCTKRKINCHASCEEYLGWRKKADELRDKCGKARLRDPREIFREYAQRQFKPETPELADAQQRLNAALEEAALTAEVLGNELRRYNNRMRANKWHGRSWGRKEW